MESEQNITYLGLVNTNSRIFFIPVQAGIQGYHHHQAFWIPACAGMMVVPGLS